MFSLAKDMVLVRASPYVSLFLSMVLRAGARFAFPGCQHLAFPESDPLAARRCYVPRSAQYSIPVLSFWGATMCHGAELLLHPDPEPGTFSCSLPPL